MVVMIVLAWTIGLPIVVVVGLLTASRVLGARHRGIEAIDVTWVAEIVEPAIEPHEREEPPLAPLAPLGY